MNKKGPHGRGPLISRKFGLGSRIELENYYNFAVRIILVDPILNFLAL